MIKVSKAQMIDLEEASELLGEAFSKDPVTVAMFPTKWRLRRRLTAVYATELWTADLDYVDIARDENGVMLGVAMWSPPIARRWQWMRQLVAAPRLVIDMGLRASVRGLRHQMLADGLRPRRPHWYLENIGVSSKARGRGVGSALLNHRLTIIDQRSEIASLEATTTGSQRLYERHGFEAIDAIGENEDERSMMMVRSPSRV